MIDDDRSSRQLMRCRASWESQDARRRRHQPRIRLGARSHRRSGNQGGNLPSRKPLKARETRKFSQRTATLLRGRKDAPRGPGRSRPPLRSRSRGGRSRRKFPVQARADLSHVNACIAILEACDEPGGTRAYVDLHSIFARGEMMRLCKDALASGPKTTKELALIVMAAKGLDTGDNVLARAMAMRMIHALRQQWRRASLDGEGKIKGARVWAMPN
jgi:hypothetical protein